MLKKYIKPTWEFVELRPEEGLADCGSKIDKGKRKRNCSSGSRTCHNPSHFHN